MILAILYLVTVLGIFLLALTAYRIFRFSTDIRFLREVDLRDRAEWPKISIIVPACNEAETINAALKKLREIDYLNLQLILVNDRSSDETGSIIARHRDEDARIEQIDIAELPSGWLGKPHALMNGCKKADGDYILLTDADVLFSSTALKRAVLYIEENELDFVAGIPQFLSKSPLLNAAYGYFLQQITLAILPKKVRDPHSAIFIGLGGFNFFRRAAWEKSAGFENIKTEVVEDMGVGMTLKRSGARCDVVNLTGEASLEWYPSVWGFIKGLEKNSFSTAEYTLLKLIAVTSLPFSVFFGAFVLPFTVTTSLMPLALMAIIAWFSMMARLLTPQHLWGTHVFFIPIYYFLFPLITLRAGVLCLKRGGIYWRGTFYPLETLRQGQRVKLFELLRNA